MRLVIILLAVKGALLHQRVDLPGERAVTSDRRKRIRRDPETTQGLILDTTEKLMVEQGYAAVSSRRIAQELGLNAATVHYYYPTTDDIFIALHKRMTDRQMAEIERIIEADKPLEAFWELQSGWEHTALGVEFLALSNHRKSLRETLAQSTEQARALQSRLLETVAKNLSLDPEVLPPIALTSILVAIGRLLSNEERVGMTSGHKELRNFVRWALDRLQGAG